MKKKVFSSRNLSEKLKIARSKIPRLFIMFYNILSAESTHLIKSPPGCLALKARNRAYIPFLQ